MTTATGDGDVFKVIAVLSAMAWAFAGWRNMPRLSHPVATAAGVSIAVAIMLGYWAGTRHAAAKVIATAIARAEATAVSVSASAAQAHADSRQVVILNMADGARAVGAAEYGPVPEWIGQARHAALDEETMTNLVADVVSDQHEATA
jgi:hypothetical protein